MGWIGVLSAGVLLGYAGWETARSVFREPIGWPRFLAASVLAWIWLTIGLQFLGAIGLLNRPAILGVCALGAVLAFLLRNQDAIIDDPKARSWFWSTSSLITLGLTLAAIMDLCATSVLSPPRIVTDGPIYHLFFAAKWWKAGRIFLIASPFGENAATYFPAGGDLFFSGLMCLFGGDRLARIGQAPFFLMSGLAAYGIARKLGASSSSSILAVCLFLTSMPMLLFSFEANVDTFFVAGYLASVAFGLRFWRDGRNWRDLVLAGLAIGGAWGTKPTATVFLPLLGLIGLLLIVLGKESPRSKLSLSLLLAVSVLAPCGFWFGRSLWMTGNPFYPMHLECFGRVILKGWYRSEAMRRSQFYIPVKDWRALGSIVFIVFDARLFPLWLAGLLGAVLVNAREDRSRGVIWSISLLAIVNIAIYWLVIPYRTQQRFMLQAVGLAAAPLALLLDRGRIWRWLALFLLAIHLFTPQNWPWMIFRPGQKAPWELSPDIPTSAAAMLLIPLSPGQLDAMLNAPGGAKFLGTIVTAVLMGVLAAFVWGCAGRSVSKVGRALGLVGFVFSFAVVTMAVNWSSRFAADRIYPTFGDYQRAWMALERLSPPGGTRVAYAGTNLPYYLMAGGLRNDVLYVNIDGPLDWQMHDFHRSAASRGEPVLWDTPRPGWDRIRRTYEAWIANLRAAKIRYLVVARANWMDGEFNLADNEQFPIERVWADEHPERFELVYPIMEPDRLMRIYRVREK